MFGWSISDGQNNHQLTFGGGENYADIAPDGQWVFYVSRDKTAAHFWKIAATGGEPVQLTFAGIILNPLVSPDGKKIACTFRGDEGDNWKLAILPSDGGEPLKTFAFPSPFYQVIRWTPGQQGRHVSRSSEWSAKHLATTPRRRGTGKADQF